jgi:hypothetical protein
MTAQLLADRIEIQELTARYNRAADATDPGALLALFTADATVEMTGGDAPALYTGSELAQLVAPSEDQRVHMTMDATVELDGDTATQECTLLLVTRSRRRGLMGFFTGRYSDELVRTPEGWRFARRVVHVDFSNEGRIALANAPEGEAV